MQGGKVVTSNKSQMFSSGVGENALFIYTNCSQKKTKQRIVSEPINLEPHRCSLLTGGFLKILSSPRMQTLNIHWLWWSLTSKSRSPCVTCAWKTLMVHFMTLFEPSSKLRKNIINQKSIASRGVQNKHTQMTHQCFPVDLFAKKLNHFCEFLSATNLQF